MRGWIFLVFLCAMVACASARPEVSTPTPAVLAGAPSPEAPATGPATPTPPPPAAAATPWSRAHQHLAEVMDKYHRSFDVYTDVGAGGNHFVLPAQMGTGVTLNPSFTATVRSGATSIRNTFSPILYGWGGIYFQNGVLLAGDTAPRPNWGDYPNAGYDLTGATRLTFWARGERGSERVEFFAFGIGRDPDNGTPIKPHPDSSPKVTLCGLVDRDPNASPCFVTLTRDWRPYTITLEGLDLSYVIGGFGWVTNAPQNGGRSITFYLDDIRYDKPRPGDLRFLVSYETLPTSLAFDHTHRNVAFTYDNALALIAFTALDDRTRAQLLADAFVYAQQNDRFYTDGRLRDAYQAGDLVAPPGWTPNDRVGTARLPGWWDEDNQRWHELGAGSTTGNLAWAMLALLNYYEKYGGNKYLQAATALGEWINTHTHDTRGAGGYTGGYEGWEPNPTKLLWKSTEHNLDLYVAFERLYRITEDSVWQERAEHARQFVEAMWNDEAGFYWTGTLDDGVTINPQTVPLDAQTWALLAFGPNERTRRAIAYAEEHHRATWGNYEGFDFNDDQDMPWFEGTAQMVVAYHILGEIGKARHYLNELREVQAKAPNGNGKGIVAAPADGLTTGFGWAYHNRLHVGATAWFLFAEGGYNPYWPTSFLLGFRTYLPLVRR
ncbi:MAG: hypothetical protein RMK65_07810 [Anaerolineae bacterium]|nr:hypothetical protein [Anaerolineae bacterium]